MRSGPHPLYMHLALAGAVLPEGEIRENLLVKMVRGIQRYQNYRVKLEPPALHNVLELGATKLHQVHDDANVVHDLHPVLLIPSLINRSSILNLTRENSFALWLARQGFPVYLLDWGDICKEAVPPDIDTLIGQRLKGILDFVQVQHDTKVHLLGYCMGGTLSMSVPVLWPDKVNSLTLLAAPWDMQAGENSLSERVHFWAGGAAPCIMRKGYLPATWLEGLFASLDPEMTLNKFTRFADMAVGSAEEKIFVAVEDWLNSGRDLPASIAQTCIIDWFVKNVTAHNQWRVCNEVIKPQALNCPVLLIASKRDRLVTYDSAVSSLKYFSDVEHISPSCGHIGMMAGRNAQAEVWEKVSQWILNKKL